MNAPNTAQESQAPETASERRNRELQELKDEGFPVVRVDRWRSRIGQLHISPYSGRWVNEFTGARGRLYSLSIRTLIKREGIGNSPSAIVSIPADAVLAVVPDGQQNPIFIAVRWNDQELLVFPQDLSERTVECDVSEIFVSIPTVRRIAPFLCTSLLRLSEHLDSEVRC